jgi:uncharacterized protein (TIGR02117 family)
MRRAALACLFLFLLAAPVHAASLLVVSNGWHSGVVLDRRDIPAGLLPETADFDPSVQWFEIGWGSALFYPARKPDWKLALRAAFPGHAVIHIAGLSQPHDQIFPSARRTRVCLSGEALRAVVARIDASIDRRGRNRALPTYPGLYPFSLFYPAKGRFHLFHTCNNWTAEMLGQAVVPVPSPIARGLTAQLSSCRP